MSGLLSEKQRQFLLGEDRRINLLTGSVRSGKTWASLLKWGLFVGGSPPGSQFLMSGKTSATLNRNCLMLLSELVGARNFSYSLHQKQGALFGRTVWFEDANDASSEQKLRGLTLSGAYLDELTLMRRDFYKTLLSRLSTPGAKLYATTNPDGPGHWVVSEIIENANVDASIREFFIDDNPFLPDDYVDNIKREYTGVFYERFILGKWSACEGLIYRGFASEPERFFYGVRERRFEKINIGVDFGGNKSAHAFVACGVSVGDGIVALKAERHPAEDIDPLSLYELILNFACEVSDRFGAIDNIWCDCAEPVLIRGLRKAASGRLDCAVRGARKLRIIDRIRAVCTLMANGRFFYTDGCDTLVKALAEAAWSDKEDNVRLDDGSCDIDTLDAFEYAVCDELGRI